MRAANNSLFPVVSRYGVELRRVISIVCGAVLLVLCGCASQNPLASRYSEQVGGGHQRVEEHQLSRKKYIESLRQGEGANNVRLVQVFRRERQQMPQYRIFDIRPGSAYRMLGLEDGDILLAANDHIVYDPAGFRTFVVEYMKDQTEATLTISRGGVTSLQRYSFVE